MAIFKCVVCTFAILMLVQNGSSDIMLNQFKTELRGLRENMVKAWHGYIRLYFFKYFKNRIHFYENYGRKFLCQIVYKSKAWLYVNNKRTIDWKSFETFSIFDKCKYQQYFEVKWPIAHLVLNLIPSYRYLYWNLNYNLRLNLTLDIKLTSERLFMYLTFQLSYCSQSNQFNDSSYIFHGQYSTINVYPLGREVVICHKSSPSHSMAVEGKYRIFDRHYLFNSKGPKAVTGKTMSSVLKYGLYPDTYSQHHLFRFYVAVRKLDKIIIWYSELSKYIVFDGPGLLSDPIYSLGNYTITTTFQTVVLMLKSYEEIIKNSSVMFASKPLSLFKNIFSNETENSLFHFPDAHCKRSPCVISVVGDLHNQINITVMSVKAKILHDIDCFYAGIVTGEWLNSEYKEIKTTCECNNDCVGRSIYSSSSSLILVIYWYKEYSEINTSLIISQTKCKLVLMDLCWLSNVCYAGETVCNSYLFNMTMFSGVDLNYQGNNFVITQNPGDCAVLQFLDMQLETHISYQYLYAFCQIELILKHSMHMSVRVSQNQTNYHFKGNKLNFCNDIQSCLEGISELMIPRLVQTSTEILRPGLEMNGEGLFSLIRDDAGKLTTSNSWIELAISSNDQFMINSKTKRFAKDFRLNEAYIPLESKLPVSHTSFSVILLKSNTRALEANVLLTVDMFAITSYNNEEICE